MSIRLERWLFVGVVLLSFLCAWRASAQVTVHKIFHHAGGDTNALEQGSFVMYGNGFTKEPLKKSVRILNNNTEEYAFTIPRASISDAECRRRMQEINKSNNNGYRLSVEEIKKPEPALLVKFTYPKGKNTVAYTHMNSIQHEKGIVFHVYNNSLIQSLKKQQQPVIRTAALHKPPRLFIDPGHGGTDLGAVAQSGFTEKELCLAVSKNIETILTDFGYTVCMSRDADLSVPLDERTRLVAQTRPDLVVSIHANAAPSNTASGIELFFLDPHYRANEQGSSATLKALLKKHSELLSQKSKLLAETIQHELVVQLPQYNAVFKDRGLKAAVSQILLGARRPAVLIEIGFLTSPAEAPLLSDKNYQSKIAHAIAIGIRNYCLNMQV